MSDRRMWSHPIISFKRGKRIFFNFEGRLVEAYEGESIITALYAIGVTTFSWSPKFKRPRGAFCMIGKCSSCLSTVDRVPNTRICIEPVREGVFIERQRELPFISAERPLLNDQVEKAEAAVDLLIIGGGPAGLHAALTASTLGVKVALVDEGTRLGGQLIKQTHKFFGARNYYGGVRGFEIAEKLSKKIEGSSNILVYRNATAYGFFHEGVGVIARHPKPMNIVFKPRAVIVCTGAMERGLEFENNDLPGIMGAGGAQTLMNQYGVKPGDKALVVGSGNVGLIVSYQLLQAGVEVRAIVEITRSIGGWFVHAAKVVRLGVPIYLGHSIVKAIGSRHVEEAVVQAFDDQMNPIPGTEKRFNVDLVLLAVGLMPDYTILSQAGCIMKWIPELGGLVPLRTMYLETSIPGLYVAGDAAGIEEATTAFIEGEVAAISAAEKLGYANAHLLRKREELLNFLWNEYRQACVIERARVGKLKATVSEEEMEEYWERSIANGLGLPRSPYTLQ
ncbi:MAG: FAD-dependent oxidoreductase [Sulfolobales archaeon]|nr:FAD-dependent oxidoreductase [Sulfolobales archaeon]MCX8198691.1 FAD-dependent oxidoreductase [Sulfolobales archaeon]